MPNHDRFILIIVIVMIIIWIVSVFLRWLYKPRKATLSFLAHSIQPRGQAVDLMKQEGYTVLHGKHKVPITMVIDNDDEEELTSQLFIDYFAQKDDDIYAVKLARERQPLRWSGSAIREQLLPLYLLYEEVAGVLYVDLKHGTVKKITFTLNEDETNRGTK